MKIRSLIVIFSAFLLLIFAAKTSYAQMMRGFYNNGNDDASSSSLTEQQNQQALNKMVNILLKTQDVTSTNQLDCSKISKDQLEKLGDSWMDVMIPNENQHQAMDNMMGGEGSQSLTNMHIGMAERYLGCTNATQAGYSWIPMMLGSFDNNRTTGGGGFFPMMSWNYGSMMGGGFGWGFGILGLIFWLVAFIDLVLLGVFLWKKIKK